MGYSLNQIMIEKSKVYPEFQYPSARYQLDHFHNPYLSKLNIKLTPRPQIRTNRLLSPLSMQNNLYISQAIPLYKDEKLKLALIWKQYVTHKYARAHFGLSAQYNFEAPVKLRSKAMVGITSLFEIEGSSKFRGGLQGFAGYSGFLQNNNLFSSLHLGFRKGIFSAQLTKKLEGHTEAILTASKHITADLAVESSFNCGVEEAQKGEVQLMLRQKVDNKSWSAVGVVGTPYYMEGSFKVEFERLINKSEKLVLCTEYSEGKSVFYLGFKNLNFNFIFPFFAVDGAVPVLLAAAAYTLAFFYRRFKKEDAPAVANAEQNPKTIENRLEQLQLIGQKAADHYEREKASRKGLRIEEAYVGPPGELQEFMDDPQRFHQLLRSEEHKAKFVDLTVTLRFYVTKGELKLRKGQKNNLLGFYRRSHHHNRIGVRYIKNDEIKTAFFDLLDPIVILNN